MNDKKTFLMPKLILFFFKWKTEQEILTRCFICSRNSYEFEQKGIVSYLSQLSFPRVSPYKLEFQSFNYHLRDEHNHLAYIFFFVKMDDTANNHLTALEMYMLDMVRKRFVSVLN